MLELNRASSNNAPPIVPQLQTSVSPADKLADTEGFPTFTEALASLQAFATEPRNETPSSSISTKPLQIGTPAAVPPAAVTPAASESLPPQSLTSLVKTVICGPSGQTQGSDKWDKTSPLPTVSGSAPAKSKPRKDCVAVQSADSPPGEGASASSASAQVLQSALDPTAAGPNPASTQNEETMPSQANRPRGAKAVAANTDLAFAVKIQADASPGSSITKSPTKAPAMPGQPDQDEQAPAGTFSAQVAGAALTAPKTNGNADTKAGEAADLTPLAAAGNQNPSAEVMNTANKAAAADIAAVAEVPTLQSAGGQSLKTVQVQITGTNNQTVDLRLMEKSGALTMSVRSSDGTLTRALQQHLPDLTSKLGDQQLRTEWWRPDVQKIDSSQKQSSSSDGNDSAASQDKGNQGKGNSGQQGGRNTGEPDWLEELTNLRKSNQNGSQYSWHL